jgi:hypothetical protein
VLDGDISRLGIGKTKGDVPVTVTVTVTMNVNTGRMQPPPFNALTLRK